MTYEAWNDRLAAHFFNATHAGKRVYLHTTAELLAEISGLADPVPDFVAAVKQGPVGSTGTVCRRALIAKAGWNDRTNPPPFLAHLCLFAMAAGREGDWASHAYYVRLWDLLGERGEGAPPDFHAMQELWRELERWTHVDLADARGRFKAQAAGKWIHVGIPIAQTTLTDAERRALPAIFEAADLEPGSLLPAEEIAGAVAAHGVGLRRRTLQLLNEPSTSDFRLELVSLLQSELAEWDGRTTPVAARMRDTSQRAGLRLWLREIDPAGFVTARLVARVSDGSDVTEAVFSNEDGTRSYSCPAGSGSISGAIYANDSGEELDAGSLRWNARLELRSEALGLRLVLHASDIRVFTDGSEEGVRGFVEARVVPLSGRFLIAVSGPLGARIDRWGGQWCAGWTEQRVLSGLPAGWRLFRGQDARGDGGLSADYTIFARPATPRVRFEGGIRSGASVRYFHFALPRVSVEWNERPSAVTCDGCPLECDDHGRYLIPQDGVRPVSQIDVTFGDRVIHEYLYVVSDGWVWSSGSDCIAVNGYGYAPQHGDPQIRGANVAFSGIPEFVPDPASTIPRAGRGIWVGRYTDEFADLRRGAALPAWSPIWIVTARRDELAFSYCGTDPSREEPLRASDPQMSRKWKALLWGGRRRALPLRNERLARLLRKYREVARAL